MTASRRRCWLTIRPLTNQGSSLMAILPVVRYMLLSEELEVHLDNPQLVNVIGLLSNVRSAEEPPFPLCYRQLCVFIALTEGRGRGIGRVDCCYEETDQITFASQNQNLRFPADPLDVVPVLFRLRECNFRFPGRYSVRFWYNGHKLAECPLLLR
jgi:hypothetical protein